jgi:hypothetical protein
LIAGVAALAVGGSVVAARQEAPPVSGQQVESKTGVEPTTIQVDAAAAAELKRQVTLFEGLLRQAVEQGGQRLAQWAWGVAPGVKLAQASNPVIQTVPLPDGSLVFNVQVPEILQTAVMLFVDMQRPQPGARPVSTPPPGSGRVGGTGVVPDDRMASRVPDPGLDPDRRYSDYVRETLIDALLEGSAVLQLRPGQLLTVAASGVDDAFVSANSLYRNPSRKLVLSIKADDLIALRSQEITRDEARSRILERRF